MNTNIPPINIKDYVHYDGETGIISWKIGRGRAVAGAATGNMCTNGYMMFQVVVGGKRYKTLSHRYAWYYIYGYWPKEIDHIDRDRSNNAISNLREFDRARNVARKITKDRSNPRGVTYCPQINSENPYMAQCGGKYLGCFKTKKEAYERYLSKFLEVYGEECCFE